MRAVVLKVGSQHAGRRVDWFVTVNVPGASRSRVASWIRAGRVRVNDSVVRKPALRLRGGESLDVDALPPEPLRAEPEPIELDILFEDDHLAVINKAAGIAVHPGPGIPSGTVVNALLHHLGALSSASGDQRPGIVHRLDLHTSGALVVAKHNRAHRQLQEQFQQRTVGKRYWAAVEGRVPANLHGSRRLLRHGRPVRSSGVWWLRIERPIGRHRRNRVRMAVSARGREAISDFRLVRGNSLHSLVEVRIHTGRTHQVRVHLASAGHPVVGDALYGAPRGTVGESGSRRYFLHARFLEFDHPADGGRMRFEAPLPEDFRRAMARLAL